MQLKFILVEPLDPRNVGSAARALKTMGHQNLVLVNPCDHLCGKAKALAHGSFDILEAAEVYSNFSEVTQSVDFLIGTTARHRKSKIRYCDSREIPSIIEEKSRLVQTIGIVFGAETSGLKNEVIHQCDLVTSIATASPHPSLNLAQSVMIFSYLASQLNKTTTQDWRIDANTAQKSEYRSMRDGVFELMDQIKMPHNNSVKRYVRGAIARLGYDDLYLLHAIRRQVAYTINKLQNISDKEVE
ncbi:MAG: TrmH family RNA methyltransferase [Bdellovibrionota bacterium]